MRGTYLAAAFNAVDGVGVRDVWKIGTPREKECVRNAQTS